MIIVKAGTPTSVNMNLSQNMWQIYKLGVDRYQIRSSTFKPYFIAVYDMAGKVVKYWKTMGHELFDGRELNQGLYFMHCRTKERYFSYKILIN